MMGSLWRRLRGWRPKRRWFPVHGQSPYISRHPRATFLILATGPSVKTFRSELQTYIARHRQELVVIGVNFLDALCVPDYHLFVNRRRFCTFAKTVPEEATLLLSATFAEWVIRSIIGDRRYEIVRHEGAYYAEQGSLQVRRNGVIHAQGGTAVTIALGVALVMGARNIYCAGMDGFSVYADRQHDIHSFPDQDQIQFDRRLMHERCSHGILRDVAGLLASRGGTVKLLTPTVYTDYYEPEVLAREGDYHR